MMEVACHRCGACCQYLWNGKVKTCKFLIRHGKLTSCRIYAKRIGIVIDEEGNIQARCNWRRESPFDYPNCLGNTNKPFFPSIEAKP